MQVLDRIIAESAEVEFRGLDTFPDDSRIIVDDRIILIRMKSLLLSAFAAHHHP